MTNDDFNLCAFHPKVVISSDVPMDKLFSTEKKSEGFSDDDRKLMDDLQIAPGSVINPIPNAYSRIANDPISLISTGTCSRERFHRRRRDIRFPTCRFTFERNAEQRILATMGQKISINQIQIHISPNGKRQWTFNFNFVVHNMVSLSCTYCI